MMLGKLYIRSLLSFMQTIKNGKIQIICFPYAGGTSSFFDVMEDDLPEYDFVKLEYAGHGSRYKEPFYNDFDELAEDMLCQLNGKLNEDYIMFGYSMGSISLVEVLKRIISRSMPLPKHIFLSAHEPRTKTELLKLTGSELDAWVRKRTLEYGAIPEQMVNNEVFWRMYLPLYRADYIIIGKYEFEKLELKTSIPTTIFYSETDTPLLEMKLWKRFFRGPVDFCKYEGQHFFILEHHWEMAQAMKKI